MIQNRRYLYAVLCGALMLATLTPGCQKPQPNFKPNIIIILADDLGYGDISAYNSGTLNTPEIDKMASEGLQLTDGYCSSATCTPSRYALLTGEYPWRNTRAAILSGTAPLLIEPGMQTMPKMLKKAGYQTAVIGKWHLGIGDGNVDWNKEIELTPNAVGFDYSYVMAATNDRVPTVYIEDHNVVGLSADDPLYVSYKKNFPGEPTAKSHPGLLTMKWHHGHNHSILNGIPRIGYQKGGKSAMWNDEQMADHFLKKTLHFIESNRSKPFFLYYAMYQPHVPRVPHPRFRGKSGMGPRGDAILEADWCVGRVLNKLRELNLQSNTLVIFSSDNGPVLNDGYYDDAVEKIGDHTPSGPFRGGKYSLFNAGTNVPFITWWPGTITAGKSDALVSQIDIMASLAALLNLQNPPNDSENLLAALTGKSKQGRTTLVLEARRRTALRKQNYVFIPPYDSPALNKNVNIETGCDTEDKLYDLRADPAQQHNRATSIPGKLQELKHEFAQITQSQVK